MATILMMSANEILLNNGWDVITSAHEVNSKMLSCESNCIVDMVMQPKFGNSSIYMREVLITSIL